MNADSMIYEDTKFIFSSLYFTTTVMLTSFSTNTYNMSHKGEIILGVSLVNHSDRCLICCYRATVQLLSGHESF